MGTPLTDAGFAELLSGFRESWFKFECQPAYVIGAEREALERYLEDGTLLPPARLPWWQEWLMRAAARTRAGRVMQRVRVLDDPPTAYQRYLLAVGHWHEAAGERITYMLRGRARRIGLLLDHDWSLFDDETVAATWFTPAGELEGRELITGAEAVQRYRALRDLALRHASPARDIAAA